MPQTARLEVLIGIDPHDMCTVCKAEIEGACVRTLLLRSLTLSWSRLASKEWRWSALTWLVYQ